MESKKLGLPIEYQELPEYFDAWNIHEDTDTKNAFLESILHRYNISTVLDLTCGTGSQVFFLAQRGYHVTGSDFSPALIIQAKKRALKENITVTLLDGDMRSLHVGHVDAVITMFNAIGHLTKTDFGKALTNIHGNLKSNGLYLFDIFNLQAMTEDVVNNLAMNVQKTLHDTHLYKQQTSTLDRSTGLLTSHDSLTITKYLQQPTVINRSFSLQMYTSQELQELLEHHGFEVLEQYNMDGSNFQAATTLSMLTVARKI